MHIFVFEKGTNVRFYIKRLIKFCRLDFYYNNLINSKNTVMNNKTESITVNYFKSNRVRSALFFVPSLLLIMNLMNSCKNNNAESNTQTQGLKDSLTMAKDTIRSQANAASAQMDEYATVRARLDSQIMKKDLEISKLKSINGHLSSTNKKLASELKTDKKLIASMKEDLNEKTKDYQQQLGLLENDKKDLMRQRDDLLSKYNKVLALGSVLHASNIRLTAIHLKKHGKREKDTNRARKADELRVDFDIDENRIAENGTKKLYLVIKDPSGNLLSNPAVGSGAMTISNGSQMNFSVLKEIPLVTNEPVKDISAEWKQEGDYDKGVYTIAIYNGGYRIGGGQVELK